MDRLTKTSFEKVMNNLDAFDLMEWDEMIFNKLAEYEKTGLEPKEVKQLKTDLKTLRLNNPIALSGMELKHCIHSSKTIYAASGTFVVDKIQLHPYDEIVFDREAVVIKLKHNFAVERQIVDCNYYSLENLFLTKKQAVARVKILQAEVENEKE